MKIIPCKEGMNVKLISTMPRKSYVDIAASIIHSEKPIEDVCAMDYNPELVKKIVGMNHLAITEFDYFIFVVEGISRVSEVQLVRKRHASFAIKSGRKDKNGKREFSIIKPDSLDDFTASVEIKGLGTAQLGYDDICYIIEQYYEEGVESGFPEEDLRYIKPQGTEAKIILAMNGHALLDFFKIRCCKNAQHEIRHMANEMLKQCKAASPDLFKEAGPSCVSLGYCPENSLQNKDCVGKVRTHKQVKELLKNTPFKIANI